MKVCTVGCCFPNSWCRARHASICACGWTCLHGGHVPTACTTKSLTASLPRRSAHCRQAMQKCANQRHIVSSGMPIARRPKAICGGRYCQAVSQHRVGHSPVSLAPPTARGEGQEEERKRMKEGKRERERERERESTALRPFLRRGGRKDTTVRAVRARPTVGRTCGCLCSLQDFL